MTLEYLKEQKEKYQDKAEYFKRLECNMLAVYFDEIVKLIDDYNIPLENENLKEKRKKRLKRLQKSLAFMVIWCYVQNSYNLKT